MHIEEEDTKSKNYRKMPCESIFNSTITKILSLKLHLVAFSLWKRLKDVLLVLDLRIYVFLMVSIPENLLDERFRYLLRALMHNLVARLRRYFPLRLELIRNPLCCRGQGRCLIDLSFIHHHRENYLFIKVKRKRVVVSTFRRAITSLTLQKRKDDKKIK